MMKKILSLLLMIAMVLGMWACGDNKKITEVADEYIPEGCRLYYNIAANTYGYSTGKPVEGIIESAPTHIDADGYRLADIIPIDMGDNNPDSLSMKALTGGAGGEATKGYKLVYGGNTFNSYTAEIAKAGMLPGMSGDKGILVISVNSKDCHITNNDALVDCLSGFDCVIVTGYGKLILDDGEGNINLSTENYDVPTLIVNDEVELVANTVTLNAKEGNPAVLLMDKGKLSCNRLIVNGNVCTAGGTLKAESIEGNVDNIVCRLGKCLVNTLDAGNVIVSGGVCSVDAESIDDCSITLGEGSLNISAQLNLIEGNVLVIGGTLDINGLKLGEGCFIQENGIVTVQSELRTINGDIEIHGGNMITPEGEKSLISENGNIIISGGEIKKIEETTVEAK